jgi:hypothetical protein
LCKNCSLNIFVSPTWFILTRGIKRVQRKCSRSNVSTSYSQKTISIYGKKRDLPVEQYCMEYAWTLARWADVFSEPSWRIELTIFVHLICSLFICLWYALDQFIVYLPKHDALFCTDLDCLIIISTIYWILPLLFRAQIDTRDQILYT